MTVVNQPKRTDYWSVLFLVVSLVVILSGYLQVPPGVHYDQMRFVVDNEYITKGLVFHVPWRQQIYYWIHGGPLVSYFADFARLNHNVVLLEAIPKLIASIYFLGVLLVWDKILRFLHASVFQRVVFWGIFVPSGFTILMSKFIPHIASYVFFVSVLLLLLLVFDKSQKGKTDWKYLIWWILISVIASGTHILAIPTIGCLSLLYILLMKASLTRKLVYGIVIATCTGILFVASTYYSGDSTIAGKSSTSVLAYIESGDYSGALTHVKNNLVLYWMPQFVVSGTSINIEGNVESPYSWAAVKNPDENHWQINGLGPFGYIAVLFYFFVPYLLLRRPHNNEALNQSMRLLVVILATYFAIASLSLYDNPSWAKIAPLLLVIPFGIATIFADVLDSTGKSWIKRLFYILIIGNAIWNLAFFLSGTYTKNEIDKYDTEYQKAFEYMYQNADLSNIRIFHYDGRWQFFTALEYYGGPYILNKLVRLESIEDLKYLEFRPGDDNWIVSTNVIPQKYIHTTQMREFTEGKQHVYVARATTPLFPQSSNYPGLRCFIVDSINNGTKGLLQRDAVAYFLSRPQIVPRSYRYVNDLSVAELPKNENNNPITETYLQKITFETKEYDNGIWVTSFELPAVNSQSKVGVRVKVSTQSNINGYLTFQNIATGQTLPYGGELQLEESTAFISYGPSDSIHGSIILYKTNPLVHDAGRYEEFVEKIEIFTYESKVNLENVFVLSQARTTAVYFKQDAFGRYLLNGSTVQSGWYVCDTPYSENIRIVAGNNETVTPFLINGYGLGFYLSVPNAPIMISGY